MDDELKYVYMKSLRHPNFILAIISAFVLFVGILLRKNSFAEGDIVVIVGTALAGIHWIWAIIDVLKNYRANKATENRNIIWVIFVIIVPPLGGIIYYAFNKNLSLQ